MRKGWLWMLAALCISTGAVANTGKIASYSILEDLSREITPAQALALFNRGTFEERLSHEFNPGFTRSVYWLAVRIDNTTNPSTLRLEIGKPQINKIDVYAVTANDIRLMYQSGDHYPYDHRPVKTVGFSFPLSDSSNIYLVRIDKHNESLQLTFDVREASGLMAAENNKLLLIGLLTGILALLIIFGLYLSLITRKKIYIFYILYITSGWLWVLSDMGIAFKYLWPDSVWLASRSRPLFVDLTVALSMQYLVFYLGGIRHRMLRKAIQVTSYIAFAFSFLWLIPVEVYEAKEVSWLMLISLPAIAGVYILLSFAALAVEVRRRNIMAQFYLAALVPLMVLTFINLMNHSAIIDISGGYLEQYGVATGYVCEAIILTFGLAYRFNIYRLEKERLHIAYERQQKETAKALLDTETRERKRIADELHDIAGSMLSAAKLNITSIKETDMLPGAAGRARLEKAEEAITAVATSVRSLSHAMSPVMMDKIGFRRSVENIISFFNSAGKIKIELLVIGFEKYDPALEDIYIAIYSITYEFLNNIIKHSGASNAIIQLVEHEESIVLVVEDNGKGLVEDFHMQDTRGVGGIRSRINYFNGSIRFDNAPGGLVISIEIPKQVHETNNSTG